MKPFFVILIFFSLFSPEKTAGQTIQGSIQNTGQANAVLVVGQPSTTLTNVQFTSFSVAVSIPHQAVTPIATITVNGLPGLSWSQLTDLDFGGRDYFVFLGNFIGNNATVTWPAGESNPILKIQFTAGVGSQIVQLDDLTADNGGSSQQVYWYVELLGVGDVTNYAAPFYASPGSGAPMNMAGGNSFVPTTAAVALPLQLIDFQAVKTSDHTARLNWTTTDEAHFSHFEMEKSPDGFSWKTFGSVAAKSLNGERADYFFDDEKPFANRNFYRLRMLNDDGSSLFSPVRTVDFGQNQLVEIWPNPSDEGVWLRFPAQFSDEKTSLRLFDATGRLVFDDIQGVEKGDPPYWLSREQIGMTAGVFWLEIRSSETGFVQREAVVFNPH